MKNKIEAMDELTREQVRELEIEIEGIGIAMGYAMWVQEYEDLKREMAIKTGELKTLLREDS